MVLLGYRCLGHYLLCLAAAAAGCWPYLYFRLVQPVLGGHNEQMGVWFSIPLFVKALGWPFANGFAPEGALRVGALGGALGLAGGIVCWRRGRSVGWPPLVPGAALLLYGLLNIWLIGKFRGPTFTPWYTTTFLLYWVGLVGLGYGAWASVETAPAGPGPKKSCTLFWYACLGVLAVLLAYTNRTYEDKAFYLYSRAPASAATLRHFRTAPTYAEGLVFQWGIGRPDEVPALGRVLERHGLSVFAPRQRWPLQGDWVLDTVRLSEADGAPEVIWRNGTDPTPLPFSHYKHLDLFLHPPNAVLWQVSLPSALEQASFRSAVRAAGTAAPGGAECELRVEAPAGRNRVLWSQRLEPGQMSWVPCQVSLTEYAGQTITLRLASRGLPDTPPGGALWRYPVIDVALGGPTPPGEGPVRPANTDLSPLQPKPLKGDPDLLAQRPKAWRASGMERVAGRPGVWRLGNTPSLTYIAPLRLPLKGYSHFFVRLTVPEKLATRYCRLGLTFDAHPGHRVVDIPLLPDGRPHTYTYDLKLLGAARPSRLTGLRLEPVPHLKAAQGMEVELAGFGLIRKRPPGT
jgi:hypothetical protein